MNQFPLKEHKNPSCPPQAPSFLEMEAWVKTKTPLTNPDLLT